MWDCIRDVWKKNYRATLSDLLARKSSNTILFSDEFSPLFQKEKNWELRKNKTEEPSTPTRLHGYDAARWHE